MIKEVKGKPIFEEDETYNFIVLNIYILNCK